MNHRAAAALVLEAANRGRCAGPTPAHTECPEQAAPAVAGRCRACQDAFNVYRQRVRRERHEAGLCTNCGEPDTRTKRGLCLCGSCTEKNAAYRVRARKLDRQARMWALIETLRGRRLRVVLWVLMQLGYEFDAAHYGPRCIDRRVGMLPELGMGYRNEAPSLDAYAQLALIMGLGDVVHMNAGEQAIRAGATMQALNERLEQTPGVHHGIHDEYIVDGPFDLSKLKLLPDTHAGLSTKYRK